ncbi:MAG: hypothetical protein JSV84_04355, partial [Gemmatimonadota bacterium]
MMKISAKIGCLLFFLLVCTVSVTGMSYSQTKDYCAGDLIIDLTFGGNVTANNPGMSANAVYDGYELMFALVNVGIYPEWVIRDPKIYEQYDLVNISTTSGVLSFASGPFIID